MMTRSLLIALAPLSGTIVAVLVILTIMVHQRRRAARRFRRYTLTQRAVDQRVAGLIVDRRSR